jgi:hypothetical protein
MLRSILVFMIMHSYRDKKVVGVFVRFSLRRFGYADIHTFCGAAG